MNQISKKIFKFIKTEFVLVISFLLALFSSTLVPVSTEYISYIDFRVLALLFCLMLIVSGFRSINFFHILSDKLLSLTHNVRSSAQILIIMCFFSSMLITNDVTLILFVPLTLYVLGDIEKWQLILLISLETVAANLGSMTTPIGNPQNLFLFTKFNMNIYDFFMTILPYSLISFIALILSTFIFPKSDIDSNSALDIETTDNILIKYMAYSVLFIVTIATVLRIIPYQATLIICVIAMLIFDYKLFKSVDYMLLLTFIFLFIFVGNLSNISFIKGSLSGILKSNAVGCSIVLSQFISNVPAAILLSDFSKDSMKLLIGTNVGGLGTLIASMASLISYKFFVKEKGNATKYLLWFTLINILFLGLLIVFYFFITHIPLI